MVVVAVDPGTKRIGLAACDETGIVVTPLPAVAVAPRKAHVAEVARVVAERNARLVVVGLPLSLDGREGPSARAVRVLAAELAQATGLPVELLDERLTTAQAEREMIALGMRRADRRGKIDSAAAALLLQAWLDSQPARPPPADPSEESA